MYHQIKTTLPQKWHVCNLKIRDVYEVSPPATKWTAFGWAITPRDGQWVVTGRALSGGAEFAGIQKAVDFVVGFTRWVMGGGL